MTLTLPRPHPEQYRVLRTSKRFNVLCCGRRWGKTTLAIDRLVYPAINGKPVAWFAPTYKTLADVWRAVQFTLKDITVRQSEQEHWLKIIGGGTVECWSLDDPDAGRGRSYARIVIDEAALVPNLERAWDQSISPMLMDQRGSAWLISTPRGTANYFHTLYLRGQDPLQTDWASWQMPSSTNPYLPPEEIEIAKRDRTQLAFAQEYLAEFVTWAGAVFRRITDAVQPITRTAAAIIGVDWGRTNDYTVFTALSPAGEVLEIERFRGIEYTLQRARLQAFWQRLGGRSWIMAEVNSMGGPVVEQLQRDGLPVVPFNTTSASKSAAIEALALAFERSTIHIPDDPVLIGELQAFEGKPMASGIMRYGAPSGQHDDMVMSLAFAWAGHIAPRAETRYLNPDGSIGGSPVQYQISPI